MSTLNIEKLTEFFVFKDYKHEINENIIEKTATKIVKFIPSLKLGQLTKFLSSL